MKRHYEFKEEVDQFGFRLLSLDFLTTGESKEDAFQKTLPPTDPRSWRMFSFERLEDGSEWLNIFWHGKSSPYDVDMERFKHPEDVLWFLTHILEKEWDHSHGYRVGNLIKAICAKKGWKPFQRVENPDAAPPCSESVRKEREKMTPALRYSVIKRDGYRCRCCGFSVQNGAMLHVDHVLPVSKGGKTEERNLQTLCSACNIGKSNS